MTTNIIFVPEIPQTFYSSLKRLLSRECKDFNNTVVIESEFEETTRDGKTVIQLVRLALTSKAFVIASRHEQAYPSTACNQLGDECSQDLLLIYPFKLVKLSVFKRTKRQSIKALFQDDPARYFELRKTPKMKIYWKLWCRYIEELNNSRNTWPFTIRSKVANKNSDQKLWDDDCVQIYVIKHKKNKYPRPKWTDKYLYLGSLREVEDEIRPRPMPGLGKTEDIKLLYLKPRYFGCWEQSEHWVQCGESSPELTFENNELTNRKDD